MSLKQQLMTVWVFTKINTRRFFRDRLAIFFTIIFPLIFLFVFGGIFGRDSNVSFNVALINQSQSQFAKEFSEQLKQNKTIKVDQEVTTIDQAKEKMNRGEIDAAVLLNSQFGELKSEGTFPTGNIEVLYAQNSEQAGKTLTSIMESVASEVNKGFVKTETPITASSQQTNDKGLSRFDYVFSGLLGFSIIGIGIFGPMNVFPELKKQGILRRLHTTPLRVWQYFLATALSQVAIALVSFAVQFAVAIAIFHLKVVGSYINLIPFLILGTLMILGLGLAIGGWAKNERQAAPLGNIITFPMMFLSGVFYPRFLMPELLQKVSAYIPLTPVIDGIRLIATEGKSLGGVMPQIGLISVTLVIIYFIAFRVFRWE